MLRAIILKFKPIKWQFSLRVLIVLTVLLACAMAYLTSYARRAKRERAIVEQYSATAFYDFQYDEEEDENHTDATPPGPWFLRRIFGDHLFARVHQLEIKRNSNLTNVDRLRELTGLKTLVIYDCPQLQNLDGLANSQLRILCIYKCPQIQDIDPLHGLTSLDGVGLWGCPSLRNVDGIAGGNLTRFNLRSCPLVKDIDSLKGHTNLRFCYLNNCPGLKHVDGLIDRTLTDSSVTDSDQLLTPSGLSSLGRVRQMNLIDCNVESLEEVWKYFDVKMMRLFRCPNLLNLKGVDQAICMETLELSECPMLTSLDGLEKSEADAVYIFHCETLSDIKALDNMPNLTRVRIEDCPLVDPATIEVTGMKVLTLAELPLLTNLDGLEKSKAGTVYIFRCDALSDIKALNEMPNLKHVRIEDCPQVDPAAIKAIYEKADRLFKATGW